MAREDLGFYLCSLMVCRIDVYDVPDASGMRVLDTIRELFKLVDDSAFSWEPADEGDTGGLTALVLTTDDNESMEEQVRQLRAALPTGMACDFRWFDVTEHKGWHGVIDRNEEVRDPADEEEPTPAPPDASGNA